MARRNQKPLDRAGGRRLVELAEPGAGVGVAPRRRLDLEPAEAFEGGVLIHDRGV